MGKWTAKVRKSKPERQGFLAILTEKRSKSIKKGLKPNDFGPNYIKMRLAKITYSFTLSRYSPVLALILIFSPSFTNKGTFTVAPVSIVACFKVRVAVSPRKPGSV